MCGYHANIDFGHEIITVADFSVRQKEGRYPFNQVPCLIIPPSDEDSQEKLLCQSGAISRYVAKIAGLYPSDFLESLFVDEAYEIAEDLFAKSAIYSYAAEDKPPVIAKWLEVSIPRLEQWVQRRYVPEKSSFIANGKFSVADIYFYCIFNMHANTPNINIDMKTVQQIAPTAWKYVEGLKETDEIKNILVKCDAFYAQGLTI